MIKSFYIKLILVLFSLVCFSAANATHIVGGVMNYKYVGNDKYVIYLSVYRDCINGIPPLDDPAIIRIWDGVSESYSFPNKPFDSILDPGLPDACASIETPVCVNWTRYVDTLILPPNDLGYTIYYQRCCRNNTILNLTYDSRGYGAMDWGATYTINIPPSVNNQHINNTSPYFVNYPPVYICVNKPIIYDNRAIDTDGDSLVYSLCIPYSGAFPYDPLNYNIEEIPPFENVVFEPPYSLANVLGGVPLTINPTTGLLTGTPNTLGQFVVGVCVDEYRNGELLTHTIRDFQFNIIDCNLQVVSSFFAPTIQCNNFTVNFQNQSSGATDYKWYFGDGDSSELVNPSHTYADTGKYTVTLISLNSITNTCLARYSQEISVQYKKIEADFITVADACLSKNDLIKFIDRSTDSFNIVAWKWNFSNGDSSVTQNPVLLYNGTDTSITATLTVTSSNGCTSTITKTIKLFPKTPYTLSRILTKCTNTGNAQINLVMSGNNVFSWSPLTGLNNPNIQNPSTNINTNITYYVTIKTPLPNGDTCVQRDSVQVKTINTVQINGIDTLKICNDSVRLSVPLSSGQTVIWSTSNIFIPIIGTTATISVRQTIAQQKYYVKITAQGCEAIDSILVIYNDTIPKIDLADNILQCSNLVNLTAVVDFSDGIIWSTSPSFNPVLSNFKTFTTTQIPKTVKYYIRANYKTCFSTDSIRVTVQDTLPVISLSDSLIICANGSITINAVVRKFTSLIWSTEPTFNTIVGTTQTITVSQTNPRQTYYLKAFYRNCFVTDSIIVNYNSTPPEIELEDSLFFCSNVISVNADIVNAGNIVWSVNSNFLPVLSTQPSFTTTQINPTQKYYIKASSGLCSVTDSISIRTQANLPQIILSDSVFACADSVRINASISNYDSLRWADEPTFTTILGNTPNIIITQSEREKTYYVKVFFAGCEITDSTKVFYNDTLPDVSLSSQNIFCSDSVFAYAFADFYTEAEWFDNRDLSHLIGTNLTLQITQPQGEKWYYFRAKYKFCSVVDSIKLDNRSIRYVKQNSTICAGDSLSLELNVQTPSQYEIIWYVNNDTIETANLSSVKFLPDESQTIYFHIDNLYGCAVNDSLKITVNQLPLVDATVDKPVINIGEQVQLSTIQNQSYSYNWTPADLVSNSAVYNPTSAPTQSTLYTVIVFNNNDCKNQDTVSVQVVNYDCSMNNIFIPNAFTPNGDGVNDTFMIRSSVLKSMHLEIYDRWGHKVFESDNISQGWNGMYKGQPAPFDAYGYYFTGECLQGEKVTQKGNVTLLK